MHKIEQFLETPEMLLDLCHQVIVALDEKRKRPNIEEKEKQLRVISRSIDDLEKNGVPVPNDLRALKVNLAAEIGLWEDTRDLIDGALEELAIGFEETLRELCARIGRKYNSTKVTPQQYKPAGSFQSNNHILRKKSPDGVRTAQWVYRDYIIQALKKFGGRAKMADVLEEVENKMNGVLLPGDRDLRQDGKTLVWKNNAQWERLRMVKSGLLKSDSPYGMWELTEDCK